MVKNPTAKKLSCFLLLTISLTSGCAQMEPYISGVRDHVSGVFGESEETADLTPAQRRLREQSKNFNKTVIQGALIGAVTGAGIQYIRGEREVKDLLIGAAAGAAVGGLSGAYIAYRQKGYADREEALDSLIVSVREKNQQTEEFVRNMQEVIAEDERKLTSLKKQVAKGEITQEEYQQRITSIKRDKDLIIAARKDGEVQLADFQKTKRLYEQDNPSVNTAPLANEIEVFKTHVDAISDFADELAAVG